MLEGRKGEGSGALGAQGDKELGEGIDLTPEGYPGEMAAAMDAAQFLQILPGRGGKPQEGIFPVDLQNGGTPETGGGNSSGS